MADEAMTTVYEAVAGGNLQAALAVAKAMGLPSPQKIGDNDPATLSRRFEVARLRREARLYERESDAKSKYILARPLTRTRS